MNDAVIVKKRIGMILLVLSATVSITRLFRESAYHHLPLLTVVLQYENLIFIPIISAILFTIFSSSKAAFFLQAITVLITGLFAIFSSYLSFYGVGSFLMGTILLYKYGFLDRKPKIKISVLIITFLLVTEIAARIQEPGYSLIGLNSLVYFITYVVLLYTVFEREIKILLTEKNKLEEEIEKSKPLRDIGEHAGGLIHNLKSDLMVILATLELYEAGKIRTLEPLGKSAKKLSERINSISDLIKNRSGKGNALLNGSLIVKGVVELIRTISDFRTQVDLSLELPDDLPVYGNGDEIAQVIENIVKNSYEAIQQAGTRGTIRICGCVNDTHGMIIIEDNAGPMELCLECPHHACISCERIGVGNTTKIHGSGIGLSYVKRIMRKIDGDIRIDSDAEGVRTTLMFRKNDPDHARTHEKTEIQNDSSTGYMNFPDRSRND